MRTVTMGHLFQAIQALDKKFQTVAGLNAMDDHEGSDLLKMLHACERACDDAMARMPPQAPREPPTQAMVSHDEAIDMDATLNFEFKLFDMSEGHP